MDNTELRDRMVREQLEARGIKDRRVLAALRRIERHRFAPSAPPQSVILSGTVPACFYDDEPQSIGFNQTISQPYIVGLMTELLNLTGNPAGPGANEKVLEIGTGSGYQTAVLAELAGSVHTVEIIPELSTRSVTLLRELGYHNVIAKVGDGYQGWPEQAPFDRIIITAAPPELPEQLFVQLAPGGIMVVPVGVGLQDLMQIIKNQDGTLIRKSIIPVRFVPMIKS